MATGYHHGDFTLPGEAGYEQLTLELAKKWGADVIRDSDGTKLSDEIVEAGYRIYSTICIIREHNAFATAHPDTQQQTFLCSDPVLAEGETLIIEPLKGYFEEQFRLNDTPEALEYWQVWDRTADAPVPDDSWTYADGKITVANAVPWHRYTASFLCWRIWEEINMYNHTTNSWTSEHLMQLDPRHPLAWAYLQKWLEDWCEANPQTDVIRLTSLFYNFVWIFGSDMRRRTRFVDWASYDFTVSPAALKAFEKEYGYALTAEDFINKGLLQATHRPPTARKRDYMDFIQRFVAEKARTLVEIIHRHGKQAYVFYDDSWVGMEPSGKYFASVGFDGLIKCVFSGFECRLCADAKVPVHELRFHPYLFPVGLGGLPTFSEGGHPERDAMDYWLHVRRALLRQSVDRIGLGGYLHLTNGFPAFVEAIEQMAVDFRRIKALHAEGAPATLPVTVAVLHTWGSLRPWTLSGHFHETNENALIHINEALSGLPVNVKFISFEDVAAGALEGVNVVVNAGRAGDAWSGGEAWNDPALVSTLTRFVHEGGAFIGVGEPSARRGGDTCFALAHVLGVDLDDGRYACHAKWEAGESLGESLPVEAMALPENPGIRLTDPNTVVISGDSAAPRATLHAFGKGCGAYLTGFAYSPEAASALMALILRVTGAQTGDVPMSDNPLVEAAWFEKSGALIALNNSGESVRANLSLKGKTHTLSLGPYALMALENVAAD
ncbi:MAG: 1,3-beta-galactosyl-N-acetylhexosamine phosphorylase [Clostridia bacterium]|nr:1,3-beta-galactosyl-N-acetylhexosamine phosphorylase [Clostridia bacterium]